MITLFILVLLKIVLLSLSLCNLLIPVVVEALGVLHSLVQGIEYGVPGVHLILSQRLEVLQSFSKVWHYGHQSVLDLDLALVNIRALADVVEEEIHNEVLLLVELFTDLGGRVFRTRG